MGTTLLAVSNLRQPSFPTSHAAAARLKMLIERSRDLLAELRTIDTEIEKLSAELKLKVGGRRASAPTRMK